ncbi:MAG: sulfatase-like hydrolase/transferase [Prolixibacteraceae bacterium]|jgi:arylsulfatase A-like enzyme
MKIHNLSFPVLAGISAFVGLNGCKEPKQNTLPNILWITSEDNSPFLGCYGDSFSTTPNLDKLASEGFLYTHAYANAPVCAPARNTIITGVYACSGGNQHMRSQYPKSDAIEYYTHFLHQKGYYCTNNPKEDYNIKLDQTKGIWDESGRNAHYKNRKPGQPFFAVFNSMISHESSLHKSIPTEQLRHNPQKVKLPPYHPDTPIMRHDWAQYYDKIEDMDAWVGSILKELDKSGEAENTIVFYYGDHGGVLGRSKRFIYESGTRVPFLVRIPKKFKNLYPTDKPGDRIDRIISFVDLSPTLLSIIGIPIPDWMQGNAFLGKQKTVELEYAYMFRGRMDERYDMSRAVRDKEFRYIRNYMPYRILGQHINYLWNAPSIVSWERAYLAGECNETQSAFWKTKVPEELYDTEKDPWEVNNLATDPAYTDVLKRMRQANSDWVNKILDTGFIPEGELNIRAKNQSFYDYMRSGNVSLKTIVEAADLASLGQKENLEQMIEWLKNEDSAVRYWAATGLLILKEDARSAIPELKEALRDTSPDVEVVAAEALYYLGEKETGLNAMLEVLKYPDVFVRTHALNAIDYTNENSIKAKQAVIDMLKNTEGQNAQTRYDQRVVDWLFEKWGINKLVSP